MLSPARGPLAPAIRSGRAPTATTEESGPWNQGSRHYSARSGNRHDDRGRIGGGRFPINNGTSWSARRISSSCLKPTLPVSTTKPGLPRVGSTLRCQQLVKRKHACSVRVVVTTTSRRCSVQIWHVRFVRLRSPSMIAPCQLFLMLGSVNATTGPSRGAPRWRLNDGGPCTSPVRFPTVRAISRLCGVSRCG